MNFQQRCFLSNAEMDEWMNADNFRGTLLLDNKMKVLLLRVQNNDGEQNRIVCYCVTRDCDRMMCHVLPRCG